MSDRLGLGHERPVANEYCSVSHEPALRLATFTRSACLVRSVAEADRLFGEARQALDRLGRQGLRLLLDFREAPRQNDPEYEARLQVHRKAITSGVARVAVLVSSAAGVLQARRLVALDGLAASVFDDESAARRYLLADAKPG